MTMTRGWWRMGTSVSEIKTFFVVKLFVIGLRCGVAVVLVDNSIDLSTSKMTQKFFRNSNLLQQQYKEALRYDVRKISDFFDPSFPLSAFRSDLYFKMHATSLIALNFTYLTPSPPPMRTSYQAALILHGNSNCVFSRVSSSKENSLDHLFSVSQCA